MEFLDLKIQYRSIKKEIDSAIQRVLGGGVFIGGEELSSLEKEMADFCKIKYTIGVNSGTDALYLSLKALGIGSGDEIITSPFTFVATAEVIANTGARPVFVDIESETFNIDPQKIKKAINRKTKAIIPVHLFGQRADMDKIMKIAKKHKLFVVEDAAQAIGEVAGDCGCFSFFPTKNLGAYGDGGMVATNNKKIADRIRLLKNHGSSPKNKYCNLILGTNSRLDALQAAILRVKLKHLSKWNKKRGKAAQYYNNRLKGKGDIIIPTGKHTFHQYTIRTKYRDKLQKYLGKNKIPTMIYYPIPLHLQPVFKYLGYKKGDFPEAEKAAKEVLSLPIYPEIRKQDQDYIIKKIQEFYNK